MRGRIWNASGENDSPESSPFTASTNSSETRLSDYRERSGECGGRLQPLPGRTGHGVRHRAVRPSRTLRSVGVIQTVASMHHIFIPLKADNIVMQSSLQFAAVIEEELVARRNCDLRGIHLFWNMIDKRERKETYESWNKVMRASRLHLLETRIPDTKRYNKELSALQGECLPFHPAAADNRQIKGSGLTELVDEICGITDWTSIHPHRTHNMESSGRKRIDPGRLTRRLSLRRWPPWARKGYTVPARPKRCPPVRREPLFLKPGGTSAEQDIGEYINSHLNDFSSPGRNPLHIDKEAYRLLADLVWIVRRKDFTIAGSSQPDYHGPFQGECRPDREK